MKTNDIKVFKDNVRAYNNGAILTLSKNKVKINFVFNIYDKKPFPFFTLSVSDTMQGVMREWAWFQTPNLTDILTNVDETLKLYK